MSHTIIRSVTAFYAAAALILAALFYFPFCTSSFNWLPELTDAKLLLGTFLTAQATIAALTLAVTLFVMTGASARRDTDDRVYHEYIRRSWVREIFASSLFAVFVTALVLVVESTVGTAAKEDHAPGLENLAIVAGIAFLMNLILAAVLFVKAIALSRPQNWLAMRRAVNERDVRGAVQAFVLRARRAAAAAESGKPDVTVLSPSAREGSANQAILALLDEGRRALAERRLGEFKLAFDSVKELISYAMDEMQANGVAWGRPGSRAEWPPLRELARHIYSLREEVIGRGDREYIFELQSFDYWLIGTGLRRGCGELFTVGLNGYLWNYEIVSRLNDTQFRDMLRDRFSEDALTVLFGLPRQEVGPYLRQMVTVQEGLLSDAMHGNRPLDFERLHQSFENVLKVYRSRWNSEPGERLDSAICNQLEQAYRLVLMGLAGRAIQLTESGRMGEPRPILDLVRGVSLLPEQLADDIAQAYAAGRWEESLLWDSWEREGVQSLQVYSVNPQKYPLMWFGIRLMEISSEHMGTPSLHGHARQVQRWFEDSVESLEKYVRDLPELGLEKRRELASNALVAAIHRDDVEEDFEVIQRDLSERRVSTFVSGVHEAASPQYTIVRAFEVAEACNHLPSDADDLPGERGYVELVPKGPFAEEPSNPRIGYGSLDGHDYGRVLANDVMKQFVAALEVSPQDTDSLATSGDLLAKLDELIQDLQPSGSLVIVLAGNWSDVEIELAMKGPAGFEQQWRVPEGQLTGDIGRYRGFPVFRWPSSERRELYVVDLEAWGQMVRGKYEDGSDIHVEVNAISAERARDLLDHNPGHFPNEPDEASKLRKLQAHVTLGVHARVEFRVIDASRARRVVGA